MKVLVVDDDRLVSASLKTILEPDSEIEVVGTLSGGAQAVEQIQRAKARCSADGYPHGGNDRA